MTKLESSFLRALGSLRSDLTKAGNIDGAAMVDARMKKSQTDLEAHEAEAPSGAAPVQPSAQPAAPTGRPKLRVWISADEGVTANAKNHVSLLTDRSGGPFRAEQDDADKQPRRIIRPDPAGTGILFFDGVNDSLQLNGSGFIPRGRRPKITMAAWVKSVGRTEAKGYRPIFGISAGRRSNSHITVGLGNSQFHGVGTEINVSHGKGSEWSTGFRAMTSWFHLAYAHDGQDDVIFINGKEVARQRADFTIPAGTKVQIGAWEDVPGKSYFLGGYIHGLQIWDKSHSPGRARENGRS